MRAFTIGLLGYDDDPREVWEFHDARRYVRWWAKFAGLNNLAEAERWLGASSAIGRLALEAALYPGAGRRLPRRMWGVRRGDPAAGAARVQAGEYAMR
jgi:hypothetical protein